MKTLPLNAFSDQSRDRQGATVLHSLPKRSLPYGRGSDSASVRRRGTVILLVVAVLALLAVIGTIYIVSARTEKANAQSMEAAYNLVLARDAIMQQTTQVIGNSLLDSTGVIAGYTTSGAGGAISHNYDYPDASEPWLAATLHNHNLTTTDTYSAITPGLFDPSTGTYDIAFSYFTNAVADQTAPSLDVYNATTNPDGINTSLTPDAFLGLLPFSDASGIRYRYGVRIIDTNRMANLNTGATDDSAALSDTFGIYLDSMRLAPAAGVLPAGSTDYFNQSDNTAPLSAASLQQYTTANGLGRAGYSTTNAIFSLASWQHQLLRFEKTDDPAIAPFDLADELALRSFGEYGTSYHIRAAVAQSAAQTVWPYTLSAEGSSIAYSGYPNPSSTVVGNPSRRNYTMYSWSQDLRPYPDPDKTKIYNLTGGSLSTGLPSTIWPTAPARISADPQATPSTASSNDVMYYTAMAATNIATLMESSTGSTNSDSTPNSVFTGTQTAFTHEEACAFAANYCTAKWDGFIVDPAITNAQAWFLPAGPSFVDNSGICIRSATGNTAASAVHAEFGGLNSVSTASGQSTTAVTNKIYLGYSAQPYFSEVAATMIEDDSKGTPGVVAVSNIAVELYNPYNKALSLNGYYLKSGDGSTTNISLTGQYVPANGYLVISSAHFVAAPVAPAPGITDTDPTLKVSADSKYILYRPYFARGQNPATDTASLAPVDQINYSSLVAPNAVPPAVQVGDALPVLSAIVTTPVDFSIGRSGGPWGPTIATSVSARSKNPLNITLGSSNIVTATGYPLPDRYCPVVGNTPNQGDPFGLGEFARITRIAHEFDSTATTPFVPIAYTAGKDGGLVADHIAALTATTSPYTNMVITTPGSATNSIDAQILFDFYGDPFTYSTAAQPTDNTGQHDIRATRLLQQLAFIDRYSEFNIIIDPTVGATDINKIRLPGRINVNTAAPDVLRAIPNMTDQMVANILAYRSQDPLNPGHRMKNVTYNTGLSADFSDATKYPLTTGTTGGIHSLAELLVPLAAITVPNPTATPATTIDQRDLLWGPICNLCTVRSDTFVVYGYLEAVRQNPNYTGSFDNKFMWYTSPTDAAYSSTLTIDNPHNTGPLVRVGRRRFLAIVDRSFCNQNKLLTNGSANPKFILPKIVAIKDLPEIPSVTGASAAGN